jgi:hypothetical protein
MEIPSDNEGNVTFSLCRHLPLARHESMGCGKLLDALILSAPDVLHFLGL